MALLDQLVGALVHRDLHVGFKEGCVLIRVLGQITGARHRRLEITQTNLIDPLSVRSCTRTSTKPHRHPGSGIEAHHLVIGYRRMNEERVQATRQAHRLASPTEKVSSSSQDSSHAVLAHCPSRTK